MRPKRITYDFATVDDDAIAEDQTLGGAGNLTLDGTEVSGGEWESTDNVAHQLGFTSTGDINTVTFTVTGEDADGLSITDTVTGVNNSTVETSKYFKKVTQIAADAAVGSNVKVGTVDEVVTPMIPLARTAEDFSLAVETTGTIDYTVQHTFDKVNPTYTEEATFIDHDSIVNATSTTDGNYDFPVIATRLLVNSYSTGAELKFTIVTAYQSSRLG